MPPILTLLLLSDREAMVFAASVQQMTAQGLETETADSTASHLPSPMNGLHMCHPLKDGCAPPMNESERLFPSVSL